MLNVMKYTRANISIPEHVLAIGHRRAEEFRLSFSDYLARLIDEDARSKRNTLTIVAEEPGTSYGKPKREKTKPRPPLNGKSSTR